MKERVEIIALVPDEEPISPAVVALFPRWVQVEEQMPPEGEDVLISDGLHLLLAHTGITEDRKWYAPEDTYPLEEFPFWTPLPEPPGSSIGRLPE